MSLKEFFFADKHHIILNPKPKTRDTTLLSIGSVKLHFLFDIEKFSVKLFIVTLVSIFMGTYNFFILQKTGLYSLGINSIFQSIARCVGYFLSVKNVTSANVARTILFWGLTIVLNIPLAILGFRKIGRKFTILSILNIVVSSLTSIFLSSFAEESGLKDFYIFSDPRTFNSKLIDKGIYILQWNYFTNFSVNGSTSSPSSFVMNDSSRVALIFLYGIVFGLLNTVSSIFIYSLGGSTGGMDWIVYYFVKKSRRKLSSLYFYLSVLITFIAYVVGTYVPYTHYMLNDSNSSGSSASPVAASSSNSLTVTINSSLNNNYHSVISSLIGPMFLATVMAALTKRIMFHFFYPHLKMITVKIFTNKAVELRRQLLKSKFPQAFTINVAIGGYKLCNQTAFEVTCFALDLKKLREWSRAVDPSCLIVATPVTSLSGKFVVSDNIS